MKVPFLPKTEIAGAAEAVLAGYRGKFGPALSPPIPVEDIAGRYLGLHCVVVDFSRKDILGATYVNKKMIAVSRRLLTDSRTGRRSFTFAHEVGHWVLHRQYVAAAARKEAPDEEAVFCRDGEGGQAIEWQADYFAACLLMPETAVRTAFQHAFQPDYIDIHNISRDFANSSFCFDLCVENWPLMAAAVCRAGGFGNVSRQAMIIRLQELGLIINHTGQPMGWSSAGISPVH